MMIAVHFLPKKSKYYIFHYIPEILTPKIPLQMDKHENIMHLFNDKRNFDPFKYV